MPYDETADGATGVAAALADAEANGKLLLIEFGANWCPDCRAFAAAIQAPEARAVIEEKFVAVKVDVGDWDKHPEVVAAWGNPIEGGHPRHRGRQHPGGGIVFHQGGAACQGAQYGAGGLCRLF